MKLHHYAWLSLLIFSLCAPNFALSQTPTWVVDPASHGNNKPPVGRSLFDYVVTSNKNGKLEYDVPYPYEKLIEKIERFVERDDQKHSPVKQVLVPMGRSLARNIARPDFFRFPRVVAAVDTQPKANEKHSGMLLKDRLYIGFGEKANILEVISYNEAAGRFEFQIVKDYKKGGSPKVFYTSREVCGACHQNSALIFSRQQWDETNANKRVAALLKMENKSFYGVPIDRGVDIPNAIDNATDRANMFALTQLQWQHACTDKKNTNQQNKDDIESAAKCRANILTFALQYALSGYAYFNEHSDRYTKQFLPYYQANWKSAWPGGLLIPDPDIPNRDPLLTFASIETLPTVRGQFTDESRKILDGMLSQTDIPTAFEPLNPRAALEHWQGDKPQQLNSVIKGIVDFIALNDIKTIDKHIFINALKAKDSVTTPHKSPCTVSSENPQSEKSRTRMRFTCDKFTQSGKLQPVIVKGRFYIKNKQIEEGVISELNINNQHSFRGLTIAKTTVNKKQSTNSGALFTSHLGRHLRFPNGNVIHSIHLQWSDDLTSATITVNELNDFDAVQSAIDKLVTQTKQQQSDVFSDRPFRRAVVMAALFNKLGLPALDWCCVDDRNMPPLVLDSEDKSIDEQLVLQDVDSNIAPFYRYCSQCHRTDNANPPNFLFGDKTQVEKNIAHCSERIFFRLSMWHVDKPQQTKTPMPPQTALQGLGFMQDSWMRSTELAGMKHYVSTKIKEQSGSTPTIEQLVERGFNNLQNCLP